MDFEGSFDVYVSREKAWAFITDAESISQCLPDLKHFELIDQDTFNADFKVGVSHIRGAVRTKVKFVDKEEFRHARLTTRGKGIGSTVDIDIIFDLEDENGGTTVFWKAEAQIGGTLAGVASKLLNPATERNIQELIDNVKENLEERN